MAQYSLYLCNDRGRRLMPLTNLRTFQATKEINAMGAFAAALRKPANLAELQNYHYIERNIRPDWQVQVWQKSRGPAHLWQSYFVLKWAWSVNAAGEERFGFGGYDANHLLFRRIVAAYAGETEAEMSDYADDMMKALVTDAMEDGASPAPDAGTRAWGDLSVAGDKSAGPSLDLAFAWEKLLTMNGGGVLPKIARAARENDDEVFFAVVPATVSTTGVTYQFRTYTGQPGRDLTSGRGRVVFDAQKGTLSEAELAYDYSEAENYIYALGQGDESDRNVQQLYDADRYKRSYWGRVEGKVEARMMETDAAVQDAGYEALEERRPHIRLTGSPVSTPQQAFGRHYDVGDKVVAKGWGKQFDALVWSALVGADEEGKVTETARLEYRV